MQNNLFYLDWSIKNSKKFLDINMSWIEIEKLPKIG